MESKEDPSSNQDDLDITNTTTATTKTLTNTTRETIVISPRPQSAPFFKPTTTTASSLPIASSSSTAYEQQQQYQPCRFSLYPDADFTATWVSSSCFSMPDPSLRFLAPKIGTPAAPPSIAPRFGRGLASPTPPPIPIFDQRPPTLRGIKTSSAGVTDEAILGRHWKQMGRQTRQYLQPTIPLPASSRMMLASRKHPRITTLGGPPGSISPLTPSKSWAQIVATSSARPQPPQQQQMTQQLYSNTLQPQQQQWSVPEEGVKLRSLSGSSNPTQSAKLSRQTSRTALRGISNLGVATSSDAQFKSLLLRLQTALDKEKETWRPIKFGAVSEGRHRDESIYWMAWILRKFGFSAETLSVGVAVFDAVANKVTSAVSVKASRKLTALTALYLSAKFNEEDADLPRASDLISVAEVDATPAAIASVERLLLDHLRWDLNRATPLKFLEILHTLVLCHQPQLLEDASLGLTPSRHLERLTWKAQRVVACHQFLQFRPATVAISLLSLDLEAFGVEDWRLVTITLEKITRVDPQNLAQCRDAMGRFLGERRVGSAEARATDAAPKRQSSGTKLKRKHGTSEAETEAWVTTRGREEGVSGEGGEGGDPDGDGALSEPGRVALKRLFNGDSPLKCKNEAMEQEGLAERFQPLQGLCINIY